MEKSEYLKLITGIDNLKQAARDKGLAKLGDEIINMCYSLAFSLFKGRCIGEKVNAKTLSEAMKKSELRIYSKLRSKSHDIADSGEAIIAYAFLMGRISLDEIIKMVLDGLKMSKNKITSSREKKEADIIALAHLFHSLKRILSDKIPSEE